MFSLVSADKLLLFTKVYNKELSTYIKIIGSLKETGFGIPNTKWLRDVVE